MTHHITDERLAEVLTEAYGSPEWTMADVRAARAVEAAVLALAAPQVEPALYVDGAALSSLSEAVKHSVVESASLFGSIFKTARHTTPLYTAPAPAVSMSEIDLQDDDALRFAQRVLESSDAPESDRKAARDTLVAIRTRVRKARAALTPSQEAGVPSNRWLTAAVDAAMVEMKNISPPMRRSECERLIRAALTAAQQPAVPESADTPTWCDGARPPFKPGPMDADKAAYFMRRFKREEKLLGPNEQAAIDFVLAMLEHPAVPEDVAREPMTQRWCWWIGDAETFHIADTESEAHDEAQCRIDDDCEPGDTREYSVGRVQHPIDALGVDWLAEHVAETIEESACEWCDDNTGAEERSITLDDDDRKALGTMVAAYLREKAAVHWWTADQKTITTHTYVAGSSDDADAARAAEKGGE